MNRSHILVGIATLGVAAGATLWTAGAASAHDFSLKPTTPTCVDGHKEAHVTVANDYSTDANMATSSALFATVPAHGTFVINEAAPGNKVGKGPVINVRLTWPDGVVVNHTYQINWGSEPCPGTPSTTAPSTTTTHGCPEGQVYSPVPPVGCYPVPSIPGTTEPPVTNPPEVTTTTTVKVCEDGQPPSVQVEDGTFVCPEFGAPPQQSTTTTGAGTAIVKQTGPPRAGQLPVTGTTTTAFVALGVTLMLFGGMLAGWRELDKRRRARQAS